MKNKNIEIPKAALQLMCRLEDAQKSCWVVGGCVRDSLMGKMPTDWDMTTFATPQEMTDIFADKRLLLAGLSHGTVGVIEDGQVYEITTFRLESGCSDHRHPDKVLFTDDIVQDLTRRDFTINAMAYHPQRGLLDCFGGQLDLQQGIIRCVGQPDMRFEEDALRILRALRFAAVLDFSIEQDTLRAMRQKAALLREISVERIWSELEKLLKAPAAGKVLSVCPKIFREILLEMPAIDTCDAEVLSKLPQDAVLRIIWLYGRLEKNAAPALKRLRCPNVAVQRAQVFHQLQMDAPSNTLELRYALNRFGEVVVEEYVLLRRLIDKTELSDNLKSAKAGCWKATQLCINGKELLDLGCPHGKEVGEVLEGLLKLCIEEKLDNTATVLRQEAQKQIAEIKNRKQK